MSLHKLSSKNFVFENHKAERYRLREEMDRYSTDF